MAEPRKKFGLGRGRAREEQLGEIRGLGRAASILDAPLSPDSGDMQIVPIDEVRIDPDNPRRLHLDWSTVRQDPEEIADVRKRQEVEEIRGLAQTIRKIGQRSPCEVVREGSRFRLVFGERRYWACRLAELSTLKVIVLREAPKNVPLVQLIENLHHRQLPLYETILNVRSVISREEELGSPVHDVADLIERTGISRATAYRYWQYLNLPKDVEKLLESREITGQADLSRLLKFPTAKERQAAFARFKATGSWDPVPSEGEGAPPPKPRPKSGAGRPRRIVSFGSTKNLLVARDLLRRVDVEGNYKDIDWNDPAAVSEAWKSLIRDLEKRIGKGQ